MTVTAPEFGDLYAVGTEQYVVVSADHAIADSDTIMAVPVHLYGPRARPAVLVDLGDSYIDVTALHVIPKAEFTQYEGRIDGHEANELSDLVKDRFGN